MLNILRSIFQGKDSDASKTASSEYREPAPSELEVPGTNLRFPFVDHLKLHLGIPMVEWSAVQSWVDGLDSEELRARAWTAAERAWLLHLRDSLGNKYNLRQSATAALLSPLDENIASATLEYMNRTLIRVTKVLDGLADVAPYGLDILIVFESEEQYYNYVSYYYPDAGEYAFSSGMFLSSDCSHFVTVQSDLRNVEPVIAHEMTHACLSHLSLPLWLDEGLAVNTEQRLAGKFPSIYSPMEMREKHLAFWGENEIQEFWSGKSFSRTDNGNMLSYDLARILVEQFSKDWSSFREFVLSADWQDGGAEAARRHLDISLGACVAALLNQSNFARFEPRIEELEKQQTAAYPNSLLNLARPVGCQSA